MILVKPKGLIAEGAVGLLLLGLPSLFPKRSFADGASDVVLLEGPNPGKLVVKRDVPLDASLLAVIPKKLPVELAFEVWSLVDMALKLNESPFGEAFETPLLEDVALKLNESPFGEAFETPLLEDVAFEPNRRGDGALDVSVLGDTPFEPEKLPTVDGEVVDPNKYKKLRGGVWADELSPEGAKFGPNELYPGDFVFF